MNKEIVEKLYKEMILKSRIPLEYMVQKHPEIKGYVLLQEYPGCNRKVGEFEPYTTGEFSKYPNIWKPVLYKEVEREKKLKELLGEN